jgi:hypothetical protein
VTGGSAVDHLSLLVEQAKMLDEMMKAAGANHTLIVFEAKEWQ